MSGRLHPADIEAIARRVAELVNPCGGQAERRMLTAEEVGGLHGVSARWVRQHAAELGAVRLGDGPKARLRFDPVEVATAMNRRSRHDHGAGEQDGCGCSPGRHPRAASGCAAGAEDAPSR